MTLDTFGNIYITGDSEGVGTNCDYTTIKYPPDSNEPLWIARYNGAGNSYDYAEDIVVDLMGNVYVTGLSDGAVTDHDCVTIKYDIDGNTAWIAAYKGRSDGSSYDEGRAIALDGAGNIYVAGYTRGQVSDNDFLTIKYTPDSNEPAWTATYNGPAGTWPDEAVAIAIDDCNNIFVTGLSWADGQGYDYATIKYTPDSNEPVWIARYNGPGNGFDIPAAITVDTDGNVYVTGRSAGGSTGVDWATVKYAPDGSEVWVARYNSDNDRVDRANGIVTDSDNNIYVTGETGFRSSLTIKYASDSNQPVWMKHYRSNPMWYSVSRNLALDSSNRLYAAGYSFYNYVTGPGEQFVVRYKQCLQSGDMNCDGQVDFQDYVILSQNWMDFACGDCGGAEITGDNIIDIDDLAKLTTYWLAGVE
jgi:uncharacterized delta-60 repeat protein